MIKMIKHLIAFILTILITGILIFALYPENSIYPVLFVLFFNVYFMVYTIVSDCFKSER